MFGCCCYHKGTYFQANHNQKTVRMRLIPVVVATTKVHIFKQITTIIGKLFTEVGLLLLPQRYIFSSKSQQRTTTCLYNVSCCCYHKGTYFQANHNRSRVNHSVHVVVVATTKVHIFKQITTHYPIYVGLHGCCCYHKGTYFQANHNYYRKVVYRSWVVVATTKVHIFKQITTQIRSNS